MPSRRNFLTMGAVIALSGCSALDSASARVYRIQLKNSDSSAHEFSITVSIDGGVVYNETHQIPAYKKGSSVDLTDVLPDERGEITVESTIDKAETKSTNLDRNTCYDVIVEYTGEDLIHRWSTSSEGCDAFTGE